MMPDLNSCSLANYQSFFHQQAYSASKTILSRFKKIAGYFVFFKLLFFMLFAGEATLLTFLLTNFNDSFLLAVCLASLFLTIFTYFVLLFYFQAKRPDQLISLKDDFLRYCKQSIALSEGTAEHHLSLVQAIIRLSTYLHDFELTLPASLRFAKGLFKMITARFYEEDLFKTRELLLFAAIYEHIKQIKHTPADLEVHASLASTYVALSRLYLHPNENNAAVYASAKTKRQRAEKFKLALQRAIEEYQILDDYAPNNPWVYAQMAQSFHNLEMPEEEAVQYEKILQLSPNDMEILFRLGVLYFQMSLNAKALRIYEQLKNNAFKKADDLLVYYNAGSMESFLDKPETGEE